jgi:hypothetical protein
VSSYLMEIGVFLFNKDGCLMTAFSWDYGFHLL